MKRLIEEVDDPEVAHAIELVRVLRDHASSPHMATRVRARIDGRARRGRLRPLGVLAALLVFCIISAASAMALRHVIRIMTTPTVEPLAPPAPNHKSGAHRAIEPVVTPLAMPEPAPEIVPAPIKHAPPKTAAPAVPSTDPAESQLIVDAYAALHQQHDTAAALEKIETYLTLYPRGPLAEEALTLALDASAADVTRARSYATLYLARFPRGASAKRAASMLGENP